MDAIWAALEASAVAEWTRFSRWGYAFVNGTHVLAVALLVGAMVPLNLRRLGLYRTVPQEALGAVLVPLAGLGLVLAIVTGGVMFAARASEYASLDVFRWKVGLVVAGVAVALALHARHGWLMAGASPARRALHAALSLVTWLAALALGRTIAFVG